MTMSSFIDVDAGQCLGNEGMESMVSRFSQYLRVALLQMVTSGKPYGFIELPSEQDCADSVTVIYSLNGSDLRLTLCSGDFQSQSWGDVSMQKAA